jgi:hypothetical protein
VRRKGAGGQAEDERRREGVEGCHFYLTLFFDRDESGEKNILIHSNHLQFRFVAFSFFGGGEQRRFSPRFI